MTVTLEGVAAVVLAICLTVIVYMLAQASVRGGPDA